MNGSSRWTNSEGTEATDQGASGMTFRVLVSETASQYLERLAEPERQRVVEGLRILQERPRKRRAGADIRKLAGTSPSKYRLRIGPYRAVYTVEGQAVKVIDVFRRGRGYR